MENVNINEEQFQNHLSEAVRRGEAEAQDKPEQDAEWIKDAYGT